MLEDILRRASSTGAPTFAKSVLFAEVSSIDCWNFAEVVLAGVHLSMFMN